MTEENSQANVSVFEKIHAFQGLSRSEARYLLRLCRQKTFAKDDTIYSIGDPSTEMFILLQGELEVTGEGGTVLAHITSGSSVGEMGVLTGSPRSATVVAVTDVSGVVIEKDQLDALLLSDRELRTRVVENMLALLCERLVEANVHIEHFAGKDL